MACGPIKSIWHWIRGQKLPSDRGLMSGPLTWALSKSSITFSFLGENYKIFQSLKPVFSVFKTCCRVFFHLLKGKDCLLQTVLVMPRVIWLPHYILSYGHISAFSRVVTTWRGCWLGLQHTLPSMSPCPLARHVRKVLCIMNKLDLNTQGWRAP